MTKIVILTLARAPGTKSSHRWLSSRHIISQLIVVRALGLGEIKIHAAGHQLNSNIHVLTVAVRLRRNQYSSTQAQAEKSASQSPSIRLIECNGAASPVVLLDLSCTFRTSRCDETPFVETARRFVSAPCTLTLRIDAESNADSPFFDKSWICP